MNVHMLQIKEDGFLGGAWNHHLARVATLDCSLEETALDDTNEQQHLGIKNMAGIFVFHFGLFSAAILLAAWKVLSREYKRQRLHKKNWDGRIVDEPDDKQPSEGEYDGGYDEDSDDDLSSRSEQKTLRADV